MNEIVEDEGTLTINEMCETLKHGRTWLYGEMKNPNSDLPSPIEIGGRKFFIKSEVFKWLRSRPRTRRIGGEA